jgi:hypothetical protein
MPVASLYPTPMSQETVFPVGCPAGCRRSEDLLMESSHLLNIRLHQDAWGRLVLTDAQGQQHVGVVAVRAFPLTDPRRGAALCDGDGKELVWIPSLDELEPALRQQVEDALARRELVPVIERIVRVSAPTEPAEWEVETDRGRARFVLNSEEDVRRLDENRALIRDAHGIRYLIASLDRLDAASRRFLERYL